jgi:hypothetical protein
MVLDVPQGLINDPDLDGTHQINKGARRIRAPAQPPQAQSPRPETRVRVFGTHTRVRSLAEKHS